MLVLHDWLKEYCGEWLPSVEDIEKILTFHAFEIDGTEVKKNHTVIDVKVLPDRASDCLSHRGIARELGTLTGNTLIVDPLMDTTPLTPTTDAISVTIENPTACRRFACALMTGVVVAESPSWLKSRLEALGQRSINNVVDATNYVMLALGQPLHAYDAKKFTQHNGAWCFGVRMARDGETVTTLTGDSYTLTTGVQLIVNGDGDTPLGIAGIKGGKLGEIDSTTTDILLEAANFDPQITRKASQALKLQTDASKRFENALSPELAPCALKEVVRLIADIAHGTCEGYVDTGSTLPQNPAVSVTLEKINALLGIQLTSAVVEGIFARLGFSHTRSENGWSVIAPWERKDVLISEDVIAEVGRVYGYEHIEAVLPERTTLTEYNARHYYSEKIRGILTEHGFSEVITSSFRKKDEIELQNSLASDKGCLRSTLTKNMQEVLDRNIPYVDILGTEDIRAFEIGTVFHATTSPADVAEHVALVMGVRSKQQGYTPKDESILTDIHKELERVLGVSISAHFENGICECNLTELFSTLPVPMAYDVYVPNADTLFVPYSAYPFVSRDIALWVPETMPVEDVELLLREHGGALLARVTLFDEFKKEGRVSYAFRLIFQSMERTLTDDEIGKIMETITNEAKNHMFEVR